MSFHTIAGMVDAALIDATLDLGISSDVLPGRIEVGEVFSATVLAPQDGRDRIQILGRTIVARLPADLHPGQTIPLQVKAIARDLITLSRTIVPSSVRRPLSATGTLPAGIRTQVQQAVRQMAAQVARTAADGLAALRVPQTPLTRAAAALGPQAGSRLALALRRLEAALPAESADPRIATLKTLTAFSACLDVSNEETLPAQISSFVSNAVQGAEPKVHVLLQALDQVRTQPQQRFAQTRALERAAAIDHDLKSLVLALLRAPAQARTPALTQTLNETLLALTGVQLDALSSGAQTSGAIAFSLPVFFHEGAKPARIRITREGPSRGHKLDSDNFRLGFVLDTANLGTVGIELHAVGRAIAIDVKTQTRNNAARFERTLDRLRARLDRLRYRVTAARAAAVSGGCSAPDRTSTLREVRGLDLRA